MIKRTRVFNPVRTILSFLIILASIVIVESVSQANFSPESHSVSSNRFIIEGIIALFALMLAGSMFVRGNRRFGEMGESVVEFEDFDFDHVFVRQLLNKSTDMIHIHDSDGKILYVNHVTHDLLGYKKDEIVNMASEDLIHPDDRESVRRDMERISHGVEIAAREVRLFKKTGEYLDVEIKGFSIHAKGRGQCFGKIFRNITSCKKNEILLQIQDEWERMFNSIGEFVSIHDKNYTIVKANSALCDFLEKSHDEIIGQSCCQIFHGRSEPHENCPHRKAAATGHDVSEIVDDPGNENIPLRITCSPLFDKNGEFSGTVHIARLYEEGLREKNGCCEIIPICAACKNIRVKQDSWVTPEEYFSKQHLRQFTHGICKSCQNKLYKDFI